MRVGLSVLLVQQFTDYLLRKKIEDELRQEKHDRDERSKIEAQKRMKAIINARKTSNMSKAPSALNAQFRHVEI